MVDIKVTRLNDTRFRVNLTDGQTETVHEVTLTDSDLNRYGGKSVPSPERLIETSFQFLLEREPKESILRSFALHVIEQYFPEYPTEIRRRL